MTSKSKSFKLIEYLLKEFDSYLKPHSTIRSLTVHGMSEENGIAKQLNHTLLEHTGHTDDSSAIQESVA